MWLKTVDVNCLCPEPKNIFKAFKLCSLDKCNSVIISQDPYPQKGVATGITFGNNGKSISPSLEIIKEGVIDYSYYHNSVEFDNSLESWCTQGILMLNYALTCNINQVGVHYKIWEPFIKKLVFNLSNYNTGLVWLLFGKQAQSLKPYITYSSNIIESYHPAYYARLNKSMPSSIFRDFTKFVYNNSDIKLNLYTEYDIQKV